MALLKPPIVFYHVGPEHLPPFAEVHQRVDENIVPTTSKSRTVFQVFQEHLKDLCLDCFPYKKPPVQMGLKIVKAKQYYENMRHYLGKEWEKLDEASFIIKWEASPWYIKPDWTDDLDELQHKLLKAKKPFRRQTIYQQFSTLNFCDEEITEIDGNLLTLKCLKNLSLALNRLEFVDMTNLISGLQHLELYGNLIKRLEGLCPRSLLHLGLGLNGISFIGPVLTRTDLTSLSSLDVGENFITDLNDLISWISAKAPNLKNLRVAGNPCALVRSYRHTLITCLPKLLCLDGIDLPETVRHEQVMVNYDGIKVANVNNQSIMLFTIDDIQNMPQPEGYRHPGEQDTFPLNKWVYTVEIKFPGMLLPTKPALSHVILDPKADKKEKANKDKEKKKGHHSPIPPSVVASEPEDPFYNGIAGMQTVQNDGLHWVWGDPVKIGEHVPLLAMTNTPVELYEYLRRGMKIKLFQKKVQYTQTLVAGKKPKKAKLPKGQKYNPWEKPLTAEVVEVNEVTQLTVPLINLLHGTPEIQFQWSFHPSFTTIGTVIVPKKKGHAAGKRSPSAAQDLKNRMVNKPPTGDETDAKRNPTLVNLRVRIHHDQRLADFVTLPPEIPPYLPEEKPVDSHNRVLAKSATPTRHTPEQHTPEKKI